MEKDGIAEKLSEEEVGRKPRADGQKQCKCCSCPRRIVAARRPSWATDKVKLALIASFTTVVLAWIAHATVADVTREVVQGGVTAVERLQTPKNGQR